MYAFGFSHESCLLVQLIICTLPLIQTSSQFFYTFQYKLLHFIDIQFSKLPRTDLKVSLLLPLFLLYTYPFPPEPHTYLLWERLGRWRGRGGTGASVTKFMKNVKEKKMCRRTDKQTDYDNGGILFITVIQRAVDRILGKARKKIELTPPPSFWLVIIILYSCRLPIIFDTTGNKLGQYRKNLYASIGRREEIDMHGNNNNGP